MSGRSFFSIGLAIALVCVISAPAVAEIDDKRFPPFVLIPAGFLVGMLLGVLFLYFTSREP